VVRMAVPVVLAVGLVVLVVVADDVVQGEAVMGGDEVDAGPGLAAAAIEEVRRTGDPRRQRPGRTVVAFPEGPGAVAEAVVPLRPSGQELPDLVAPGTAVPGLGDELRLGQRRVLQAGLQEARALRETRVESTEDGGEVEAKAVHPDDLGPVAQAVG